MNCKSYFGDGEFNKQLPYPVLLKESIQDCRLSRRNLCRPDLRSGWSAKLFSAQLVKKDVISFDQDEDAKKYYSG
jgi:hypothetical protein